MASKAYSVVLCLLLAGAGCENRGTRSALQWKKLKSPYQVRVQRAREQQKQEFTLHGEPVQSELQRTEEALQKAIGEVFDGREAEIAGDKSRPFADVGLREWRVEELIILYHPEISQQLVALDQMAANPNLILAIFNNLKILGNAGVTGGIVESRAGSAADDIKLSFNSDTRFTSDARAQTAIGLEGYFKDAKTHMLFEKQLMLFRHQLIAKHKQLWPILEEYAQVNAADRAARSLALLNGILGRGK
ncbi:MAG: hypothetical protein HYU36_22890 [Planctomycetes bacterium]|nr:hypothetical protein [Planctomycetota bacterium]